MLLGGRRDHVESRRDQSQEDSNLLIWRIGNLEQPLHYPHLLCSVSILLASRFNDGPQMLENALRSVLQCSSSSTDCGKSFFAVNGSIESLNPFHSGHPL